MLGLVDLGDQTGAIEYMAVMTAVAYRTVVDTVYPLGFLLLGESCIFRPIMNTNSDST